jgi:hypothetical protein
MKIAIAILAALIGLVALPAKADIKTQEMVNYCQAEVRIASFQDAKGDLSHFSSDEWAGYGMCVGYFSGFLTNVGGLGWVSNGVVSEITVTDNHTIQQSIQLFLDYTIAHPDALTKSMSDTVINSMVAGGFITTKEIGVLAPLNKKPTSAPVLPPDGRQTAQLEVK